MLPTLRQLQYLTLLAQHGSFSRAAEAAFVTQPTLSAAIQELERTLGAPVVDRARTGVILTTVGEEAAKRAAEVLLKVEDLVQASRSSGQPLSGRFRLGVIPTVAPFLLPRALPALRERFPKLRLLLREDLTAKLVSGLKAGALDAALIALPYDTAGLETSPVGDDELLAAAPRGHPLVQAADVEREALEAQDMILLEDGHCLRDHALAACGFDPSRDDQDNFAATSLHTLVQMVGSGLGVSLLPAMAVEAGLAEQAGVAVRPLRSTVGAGGAPRREIVVAWRRGSSRETEARMLAETLRGV